MLSQSRLQSSHHQCRGSEVCGVTGHGLSQHNGIKVEWNCNYSNCNDKMDVGGSFLCLHGWDNI